MPQNFYLSLVVPAYKEEKRLNKIIEAIQQYEKKIDFSIETIIVNDGSPDQTGQIAKELVKRVKNGKVIDRKVNKGKGYTVREGIQEASGKYILFTDADNSTPLEQVNKLLKYMDSYEVVIGSRYTDGGKMAQSQPVYRIIGARVLNIIIQLLAVRGIKDTQCGFKLFKAEAAKEIFKRQTFERFSFDIEILAIARKLGYKIKEVGITWYDDPHSTVNPIKDGLRMIQASWEVRRNIMAGKYK